MMLFSEGILKMVHLLLFFFFPHMKSHTFIPTFVRYSFTALFVLWVLYVLADFHINQLPWSSLEEWFMIAGEALVFWAFIFAFRDTRKTPLQSMFEEAMEGITESLNEYAKNQKEELSKQATWWLSEEELRDWVQKWPVMVKKWEIPDWLKPTQKTTKGIPLSAEHRAKISASLKKMNAEKKAKKQRIHKTASVSAKRKATRANK